jgi:hypothetical protein
LLHGLRHRYYRHFDIQTRVSIIEPLKLDKELGYCFNKQVSQETAWEEITLFVRAHFKAFSGLPFFRLS